MTGTESSVHRALRTYLQLTAQMHTPIAHKAVLAAGEAIALAAAAVIENPERCQRTREELNRANNDTYICPISKKI